MRRMRCVLVRVLCMLVFLPSSQNRIYLPSTHPRARWRWASCVGGGGGAGRRAEESKGALLSLECAIPVV